MEWLMWARLALFPLPGKHGDLSRERLASPLESCLFTSQMDTRPGKGGLAGFASPSGSGKLPAKRKEWLKEKGPEVDGGREQG